MSSNKTKRPESRGNLLASHSVVSSGNSPCRRILLIISAGSPRGFVHFRLRPATLYFTDGIQKHAAAIRFRDIGVKANPLRLVQKPFGLKDRVSQNCSVREKVFDGSCCFKPVDEWHRNIENHEVRLEFLGSFDGHATVVGLPTNNPVTFRFQHGPQAVPQDFVIVGEQNPHMPLLGLKAYLILKRVNPVD